MPLKSIYEVREELEQLLRRTLEGLHASPPGGGKRKSTGSLRVSVTVNPGNDLDILVVSPVFEGRSFDERRELVWSAVESQLSAPERERIERFDLLTRNEAKILYPSTLQARNPFVPVS